jgi:hypothetical protein
VAIDGAPYLWNINVNIKMAGEIARLTSRNHPIVFELSQDKTEARVTLKDSSDKSRVPERDFVLLIRDSKIN